MRAADFSLIFFQIKPFRISSKVTAAKLFRPVLIVLEQSKMQFISQTQETEKIKE
jgi:hypothetical protein